MDKTYKILEIIVTTYEHADACYLTDGYAKSGHANNSYHYRGEAVDYGSGLGTSAQNAALKRSGLTRWAAMDGLAAYLYQYKIHITELIHTPQSGRSHGWYVKNGRTVSWSLYGSEVVAEHANHVHFAVASLVEANKILTLIIQKKIGGLAVDGDYGSKTKAAVVAFQKANGLTPDGVVGLLTAGKMAKL